MDVAATPVARERGWGPTVAALVACLVVAAAPLWPPAAGLAAALVRVLVPVEQTMLLVVPAVAACALVGWWAGGRLALALAWLILAAWVIRQPIPAGTQGYATLARGWALLVASAFGLVCLVGPRRPFLVRGLGALGLSVFVSITAILAGQRDPRQLGAVMEAEYERRVESSLAAWHRHTRDAAWRSFADGSPELAARAEEAAARISTLPRTVARVAPALLGLESLAALGLAWGLYHRLSRARLGAPLGSLRTFRFSDQLVWALVAGATMAILPSLVPLRDVGINLLIFFGALYALRGLGILRWLAPDRVAALALLGVLLLVPVLGVVLLCGTLAVVALAVGLGDTWGDWRNRGARPTT
jgi:hypothetical protein